MAVPKQKNNLPLPDVTFFGTVSAMNSKANEQVLTALRQVVGATLKNWLDENKAEVLQALLAAADEHPTPPQPAERREEKHEVQFLKTAELAARWQLHPETVRKMLREGRLPRMFIGRRCLVPMSAIMTCEEKGVVPSRR